MTTRTWNKNQVKRVNKHMHCMYTVHHLYCLYAEKVVSTRGLCYVYMTTSPIEYNHVVVPRVVQTLSGERWIKLLLSQFVLLYIVGPSQLCDLTAASHLLELVFFSCTQNTYPGVVIQCLYYPEAHI